MEKEKIDLNAPAFGEGAQKIEEAAEETEVKPVVEEAKKETVEETEEESKVPYSRFKKFHDEAIRLRKESEEWRGKAETIKPNEPVIDPQDEAYKLWLENFGDNETSRKAWKNQLKITETLEARALQKASESAREAVRAERLEEEKRVESNMETIDESFEDLSAIVGRDLTEKEQSALLDIIDDYTPKDKDGHYSGAFMPFEKAWEIYELKNQASKAPKIQARNNAAALSGSRSEGESSQTEEANKNWNPLDWDAYKRKL